MGMTIDMFPTLDSAMAVADELIMKNRDLFPGVTDQHPDIISEVLPIANRYWYVHSEGSH